MMEKQLFVIFNPTSSEVIGAGPDKAEAEKGAKTYGPGFKVLTANRGADGNYHLQGFSGGSEAGAPDGCLCPDCPNNGDCNGKYAGAKAAQTAQPDGCKCSDCSNYEDCDGKATLGANSRTVGLPAAGVFNEAHCRSEWQRSAALRAEFGTLEKYLIYRRKESEGCITICGGGVIRARQ